MLKASDADLSDYLANTSLYQDEFVLAVLNELNARELISHDQQVLREELQKRLDIIQQQEMKRQNEPFFPLDLEKKIRYASYLLYCSVALSVLNAILRSNLYEVQFAIDSNSIELPTSVFTLLFGVYIQKGSKLIRNLFPVYTLFTLLLSGAFIRTALNDVIAQVQNVINIVCIFLLFSPASNTWYRQQES